MHHDGTSSRSQCDVVWRWPAMAGSDRRGGGCWCGWACDDASLLWRQARSDARDRAVTVGRRGSALGRPPLGRVRLSHSWRPEFLGCALCCLALGRGASCKLQLCVALYSSTPGGEVGSHNFQCHCDATLLASLVSACHAAVALCRPSATWPAARDPAKGHAANGNLRGARGNLTGGC